MIKFIFALFRKQFVRLVYKGHFSPRSWRPDRLEFAFYDLNGAAYYSFSHDKIPILRKINIAMAYTKLATGISELDISESLQAIHNAINHKNEKGLMTPQIHTVGFICSQLLSRRGRLVVPEYLYELAANYFIREDEDFDIINDSILESKIESIRELPQDVLRSFFFSKELNEIFPFAENPEEFFADILTEGKSEIMAYLKTINPDTHVNTD